MSEQVREQDIDDPMFVFDDDDDNTQANKFLLFNIGEEAYGISIVDITEIVEMQRITEVPDMPDFLKGVINLRGNVVPLIDLRLRFGIAERVYDDRTCIIIVRIDKTSVGFIVDTVADVHSIRENDINPPPSFKTDTGRNCFIGGLGKVAERVIILVDTARILADRELQELDPVASQADSA